MPAPKYCCCFNRHGSFLYYLELKPEAERGVKRTLAKHSTLHPRTHTALSPPSPADSSPPGFRMGCAWGEGKIVAIFIIVFLSSSQMGLERLKTDSGEAVSSRRD